eukprot:1160218-Pelagomonas_calceolata.AAC.15
MLHLKTSFEDESGLLSRLREAVELGPDPDLLSLDKCTGCKRCGIHHGGGCEQNSVASTRPQYTRLENQNP